VEEAAGPGFGQRVVAHPGDDCLGPGEELIHARVLTRPYPIFAIT
jgi:hypothetical protein